MKINMTISLSKWPYNFSKWPYDNFGASYDSFMVTPHPQCIPHIVSPLLPITTLQHTATTSPSISHNTPLTEHTPIMNYMNMKCVSYLKSTQYFSIRKAVTLRIMTILSGALLVLSLTRVPGSSYYWKAVLEVQCPSGMSFTRVRYELYTYRFRSPNRRTASAN